MYKRKKYLRFVLSFVFAFVCAFSLMKPVHAEDSKTIFTIKDSDSDENIYSFDSAETTVYLSLNTKYAVVTSDRDLFQSIIDTIVNTNAVNYLGDTGDEDYVYCDFVTAKLGTYTITNGDVSITLCIVEDRNNVPEPTPTVEPTTEPTVEPTPTVEPESAPTTEPTTTVEPTVDCSTTTDTKKTSPDTSTTNTNTVNYGLALGVIVTIGLGVALKKRISD